MPKMASSAPLILPNMVRTSQNIYVQRRLSTSVLFLVLFLRRYEYSLIQVLTVDEQTVQNNFNNFKRL